MTDASILQKTTNSKKTKEEIMLKRCIFLLALSSCAHQENKSIKMQLDPDGNVRMDSKTKCNTRFKWAVPAFKNIIHNTDDFWSPRIRSGSDIGINSTGFMNHDENELSAEQKKACEDIYKHLSGEWAEKQSYRIQQWFNPDDIKTLVASKNNEPVELRTESFVIINEYFKNARDKENGISGKLVTLSASVSCDNKWAAKKGLDEQIYFMQPEGQCKFYVGNYKINLPGGPKFVEISGTYSRSTLIDDVIDVIIENYGF